MRPAASLLHLPIDKIGELWYNGNFGPRRSHAARSQKKAIKKHPRELGCLSVALLGALQLSLHSLTFGAPFGTFIQLLFRRTSHCLCQVYHPFLIYILIIAPVAYSVKSKSTSFSKIFSLALIVSPKCQPFLTCSLSSIKIW